MKTWQLALVFSVANLIAANVISAFGRGDTGGWWASIGLAAVWLGAAFVAHREEH